MATKQDIDAGIAINMAGTVPGGHALTPIRGELITDPRKRQWVIGQVVSKVTNVAHPDDADDTFTPNIHFVDMVGITDPAMCDQLAAMAQQVRNNEPGQGRLEGVG